jgi:hypothetical protein
VENLTNAIQVCLAPETAVVARTIAAKINQEDGVRAAVDSFHARLPYRNMECDLIKGEPAAWKFKKGRRVIKMSKLAAMTLKNHGYLQEKHLKR